MGYMSVISVETECLLNDIACTLCILILIRNQLQIFLEVSGTVSVIITKLNYLYWDMGLFLARVYTFTIIFQNLQLKR